MATRRVYLFENDISALITTTPGVVIDAGEFGQVMFADIPSLQGNNSNGIWDSLNPASFLFGTPNYSNFEIDFQLDGVSVLKGDIKAVRADNTSRIAEIEILTPLQRMLQSGCIYTSGDEPETPAAAAMNILDLYKIPFDSSSFSISNANYDSDSVYIMVNMFDPQMTVLDVLQRICEVGLARMYAVNGVVFFDAFQVDYEPESLYTFSDEITNTDGVTIYDEPKVELVEKEEILGYSIKTATGVVQDGPEDSDKGKSIDGSAGQPITIANETAGTSIGLRWVNYSQHKQTKVIVNVPTRIVKTLPLGATVTINYTRGNWSPVDIVVTGLDKSNTLETILTGITP